MGTYDHDRVADVLQQALELDPEERKEFLDEACGDDPELRRQVETLLEAEDTATKTRSTNRELTFGVGQAAPERIGLYKILEVLGEGGMGVVYLAEQEEPIRRRVALKLIKLGMDTKQVIARFESERQALALMNHPGVATVLDAGATEQGRPFFVMEYVPGSPITKYCDEKNMGIRDRLGLFTQTCEAIQHAHQKGIIHRDIKPSNVLVAMQDDKPVVKVIDFGVAKATGQRLTERTLFTQQGILIGTPAYMSPEQAGSTGLEVDTRTDIYSLGVLLYELLVGALPFDPRELREAAALEILRMIREDEPPKPTTKISGLGDSAREIAKRRQTDVRTLGRQLGGELDWITMRALEKDPGRRYASASEFAADVGRHLADEPVLASLPSKAYRLRKLIRRNRGPVAAAVAILATLIAGLAISTILYLRAESARRESERRRVETRAQSYIANVRSAAANLQLHQVASAYSSLEQAPEELRAWEWRYLKNQLDRSILTLDDDRFVSVDYDQDGQRIVAVSRSGAVKFYDSVSGHELSTVSGPSHSDFGPRWTAVISPDGTRVAFVPLTGPVLMWDIARGREIATIDSGFGVKLLFSPDGERILLSSFGHLRIWDTNLGKELGELGADLRPTGPAAFGPDGEYVAAPCADRAIRLWNVTTTDMTTVLPVHRDERVKAVAFSFDGTQIASGSEQGTIRLWDIVSAEQIATLYGHAGPIVAIAFSPDGTRIASASQDHTVGLWDATRSKLIAFLSGHDNRVAEVAFSPDGTRIVSRSGGTIKVWDAVYGEGVATLPVGEPFGAIAFGADGRRIAVNVARGGQVKLLGVPTGGPVKTLGAYDRTVMGHPEKGLAWSSDGRWIAAIQNGSIVVIWDSATGDQIGVLQGHGKVFEIAFSPDGTRIASGGGDNAVRVWDTVSGEVVHTLRGHEAPVYTVAFGLHDRVVSGAGDSMVMLWDASSGERLATLPGHAGAIASLSFSPDGTRIVSGASDRTVKMWDAVTHAEIATLRGHSQGVSSIAFSPDGRRLASAALDRTIRLWDTSSGEEVLTLAGGQFVSFSPDGDRLASLADGFGIRIWDSRPVTSVLAELRERGESGRE